MLDSNRLGLKATIITIGLLFISLFIYVIFLYMDLNDKRTKGFEETISEILYQTPIIEVTYIEQYNGQESYHVVYGINEEKNEKIIFYPLEGEEKSLTTIDVEETLSKDDMKSLLASECVECKIVDITPSLMEEDILWELIYYDEDGHYVFDYRSIHDGTEYEKISYVRKFN